MHGARLYVSLPGCYIATVNESETITAAKPFCPVRSQTSGPRPKFRFGSRFRFKSGVYGHGSCRAELSLVRFENVGLRYGLGPEFCATLLS